MPKARRRKAAQPITKSTKRPDNSVSGPALIRRFHTLQTSLSAATNSGDAEEQTRLQAEIDALGGLETYQKASIRGQDKRRGGDSSKQLVEWLKAPDTAFLCDRPKMRVLEIGSLSTDNYISKYSSLEVSRIDLNAQDPRIEQQNFLDRPEPTSEQEEFEGISCSLVLNFVPAAQRAAFLLHLTRFLPPSDETTTRWLFFVMPAPCINNSRYTNKALMLRIFKTLGLECVKEKVTDKIAYWLFKRIAEITPGETYKKVELQSGKARNNFFIPLKT